MPNIDLTPYVRDAGRYVEEHGWAQGMEEDNYGRVCLTGALYRCTPQPENLAIIRVVLAHRGIDERWNDADGRKREEVLEALRTVTVSGDDVAEVFGPQCRQVVSLLRQLMTLSKDGIHRLIRVRDTVSHPERSRAFYDARDAAEAKGRIGQWFAVRDVVWATVYVHMAKSVRSGDRDYWYEADEVARDAADALAVRDVIEPGSFDLLYGPWGAVFGPPGTV